MPLFQVRLESQTDAQWRQMVVEADDELIARAICERQEQALVDFSLLPVEPVEPILPDHDAADAEVRVQYIEAREAYATDLESYSTAKGEGQALLDRILEDHSVDENGKVHGPDKRAKAHLHAHLQELPYKVVSVEPVIPDVDSIITAIKALQGNKDAWDRVLKALKDDGTPLAAVTASLFGLQWQKNIDGSSTVVWSSATIKVALTTSAYTPDQDTHDFFNDVTNEITGTGYTAGGATLGSKTSTYDTATDQIRLDAADTSWTTSTLTARRAVVYNDTAGASSTDPLLGWVDFGADVSTTAGTFLITWDATGIIVFDVT